METIKRFPNRLWGRD